MCLEYFNLLMMIFMSHMRPFRTRAENNMEAFNEFCILLANVLLTCFSDENPRF